MTPRAWGITVLIGIVLAAGGYMTFTYFKEKPPSWLVGLFTKTAPPPPLPEGDRAPLMAPEGFTAYIYSRDVPGARVMIRDQKGTMLVSSTKEGKVLALPDLDGDGKADEVRTVLEGLKQPHGLSVICPETGNASADADGCTLYVAETGSLKAYAYDADTMTAASPKELATFPTGDGHYTRTLLPHPNGRELLISIGSSCNVCNESNPLRATVQALDLATNTMTTIATGLRNSVFMATDPVTGEVWATENGRDVIGDDIPPDELNIITGPTTGVANPPNFGWPIYYGQNVNDRDFDKKTYIQNPCHDKVPAHKDLQAHSAALGLAFVPEEGWPEDMANDVVVAYHGSWNRATPTGYKVVRFDLDADRNAKGAPIDFLTGFLEAGQKEDEAIGRPVGVLAEPGGIVYISDDRAGAIYRIVLNEPAR